VEGTNNKIKTRLMTMRHYPGYSLKVLKIISFPTAVLTASGQWV